MHASCAGGYANNHAARATALARRSLRVTSKTEAAHDVRKVLEAVRQYWTDPSHPKLTEADTRAHFIDPLLRALGYRAIGDIQHEVFVPDAKQYLDYRLLVDGAPRLAVEAKAVDFAITDAHGAQVIQYCSVLGDEWAVATNGRQWRLYHAFAKGSLADKHLLSLDLIGWETDAQFDSVFEQLWLISKDSFLLSGGPASWLAVQQLNTTLRRVLTDPTSPELSYLRARLADAGVAITPDAIATWFQRRLDPEPATTKPTSTTPPPTEVPKTIAGTADWSTAPSGTDAARYWLIPAGNKEGMTAAQHLRLWLDSGFWGLGERTPGRKAIKAGHWACFYAAKQNEVVAYARVSAPATTVVTVAEWPKGATSSGDVVYKLPLTDLTWLPVPVRVDPGTRASLEAFSGKNPEAPWSWLVQTTRRLSERDYMRLTGR